MPFVNVKLIKGVFDADQKREMIEKLTDTMVEIEGESMRPVTWVTIEEVESGDGDRRRPSPTQDVRDAAHRSRLRSPCGARQPSPRPPRSLPRDRRGGGGSVGRRRERARRPSTQDACRPDPNASTPRTDHALDHRPQLKRGPPPHCRGARAQLAAIFRTARLHRANAAAGDQQASLGADCFDRMMAEGLFHILVRGSSAAPAARASGSTPASPWLTPTPPLAGSRPARSRTPGSPSPPTSASPGTTSRAADHRHQQQVGPRPSSSTASTSFVPGGPPYRAAPAPTSSAAWWSRPARRGSPETRMVLQPAGAAAIEPTWDTLGLRIPPATTSTSATTSRYRPGAPSDGPTSP